MVSERERTARRRKEKCQVPGCVSFARANTPYCWEHKDTPTDPELEDLPYFSRVLLAEQEQLNERRAEFKRRLEAGNYRELFGSDVSRMIDQAVQENGVDTELGALRVVMARAMVEIDDPGEQARVVASVTSAIGRLLRTQHLLSGALVSTVSGAVMALLQELDGETS